jgi:hypothetical protein
MKMVELFKVTRGIRDPNGSSSYHHRQLGKIKRRPVYLGLL